MSTRMILMALLTFSGAACEKEIHEVRLEGTPRETLVQAEPRATNADLP